jgi:hypothetical protein
MKTEVIMRIWLLNEIVEQKSKSWFFCATDIINIWNKIRRKEWLLDFNFSQFINWLWVKEFINELKLQYWEVIIKWWRWRNSKTWVHPLLFIDIALALSPKFKIEVYKWLEDNLLRFRNENWDNYKLMSWWLWINTKDKTRFWEEIKNIVNNIKIICGVQNWELANEDQLKKRDNIQRDISLACDIFSDNKKATDFVFNKYLSISNINS